MRITDEQYKHLRESFAQYDVDGNNLIDKAELVKVLIDLKVPNPEKEVDGVMAKLDNNNDGTISFAEFLKAVRTINSLKEVEVDDIVANYTSIPASKLDTSHGHASHEKKEGASFFSRVTSALVGSVESLEEKVEEAGKELEKDLVLAEKLIEKELAVPLVVEDGAKVHGITHLFAWKYEGHAVHLVGDFTHWGQNKLPMKHNPVDGHFYLDVKLTPGVYEYRFIINDNIEWYYDILEPNVLNTGSWFINNILTL